MIRTGSPAELVSSIIIRHSTRLRRLSLHEYELDAYPWSPAESWPDFFERRLRPMIFFLHAGVMQGFMLTDCDGAYTRAEFKEIQVWITAGKRLLLLNRSDLAHPYVDDWAHLLPRTWEIPGEATAMFEILYRICDVFGFPEIEYGDFPINRHLLLPLIAAARKTRDLYNTSTDYFPYNDFGDLIDPALFHPETEYILDYLPPLPLHLGNEEEDE
ncbi:hypothetical protein C8R44DRAFT_740800 [Mycena epipterygia]|nr:hypothetical protein C8R44DRAFT_740800 [Mycena epipterygia]